MTIVSETMSLNCGERPGLSQAELAEALGVTDKAVSKWENGKAKPSTKILQKLSACFGVSIEQLLQLREESNVKITKIVITGGPCAGKSTAMSWIQNAFAAKGYQVLFVPETATELITGGVAPWTCGENLDYQKCQMRLQLQKEAIFEQAARTMKADRILIVCDRGALDNRAYMNDLEFACVLESLGLNEVELRDGYDGVFHLVSAAKGAAEFYTTANNEARTETAEEAAALDDRIIAAWTGHPRLRVIDNATDFQQKMKRLIGEIAAFLGEPEPLEIERKYLIEYPDLARLEHARNCKRVEINQTYLVSAPGEERRIRQRGSEGHYVYYETIKREGSGLKRVEVERRLSQSEYLKLSMEAEPARRPIRKTRYCLTEHNVSFEIDVYPFWNDKAILEVELSDEAAEIRLPGYIHVIREVTEDEAYKNAALALI